MVCKGNGSFSSTLRYWDHLKVQITPKIVSALTNAVGSDGIVKDVAHNYRMVDYYQRPEVDKYPDAPRCVGHRDFGSFTLIFPRDSGLQVYIEEEWI